MSELEDAQAEERPHIVGIDGRPLRSVEWRIYLRAGIDPGDVEDWIAAGISPYQAEAYRAAGLDVVTAARLASAGVSGADARRLGDPGELMRLAESNERERVRLGPWTSLGVTLEHADALATANIPVSEAETLIVRGCEPRDVALILLNGVDVAKAVEWTGVGVPTAHLLALHGLALSAESAASWSRLVAVPSDAERFAAAGFSAEEAAPWWRNGMSPDAARSWESLGLDPEAAHRWSFRHFTPAAAEVWVRSGFDASDSSRWRDLSVEPLDASSFRDCGVRPQLVNKLSKRGFDASRVLQLARATTLGLRSLERISALRIRADEFEGVDDSALGAAILAATGARELETTKLSATEASAFDDHPPTLMRVLRIGPDGSTSLVTLEGPQPWTLRRDGTADDDVYDSIESAMGAEAGLREVRHGQITLIEVNTSDRAAIGRLAELLVVTDADMLDESPDDWEEFDSCEHWATGDLEANVFDNQAADGVGTRPIYINGHRWVVTRVDGAAGSAVVLPAESEAWSRDERLVPALRERWMTLSVIEEASRVSGWSHWALGRCTDSVGCEIIDIDEGTFSARTFACLPLDRLDRIVDWIASADTGVHLLATAVRTVAGLGTSEVEGLDHSPTLVIDLDLDVEPDEVDEFLELLRDRFGSDAVDRWLAATSYEDNGDDDAG